MEWLNSIHQILITQLESLLSYSERFCQRQFLTRRATNYQLPERLHAALNTCFGSENSIANGFAVR